MIDIRANSHSLPAADSTAQGSALDGTRTGDGTTPKPLNFDQMSKQERRDLHDRLRNMTKRRRPPPPPESKPHIVTPEMAAELDGLGAKVLAFLQSIGIEPTPWELNALLSGEW